jgi:hypothetical protein
VQRLLERHGQHGRIGRYVWQPLCVSALNTPPDRASANVFLAVLRDSLAGAPGASDLVLPRVDLSRLFPEPAAGWLRARGAELRFGAAVRDLAALRAAHDAVILAVGPHQLKALAPGLAPDYEYQPITTCYLQYPAALRLPFPMLGLAGGLVQWVFDRGWLNGEAGRLAAVISALGEHQQMTQEELARPEIETPLPGVLLAGDYTDPEYPPTLEAAVRSGVRAAERAMAS